MPYTKGAVRDRLKRPSMATTALVHYASLIAGGSGESSEREVVRSPYDDRPVATVAVATAADMEIALQSASAIARQFGRTPRYERAALLRRIAAVLKDRENEFAALMVAESGKPDMFAHLEVQRAVTTFSLAADEVTRTAGEVLPLDLAASSIGYTGLATLRPIGVIGAIAPFNFPLNLVAHKLAPAIAVGNPVVLKAPPQAPLCAHLLGKVAIAAGMPPAALSVMHAPVAVAQTLATDERVAMLSFTGSAPVGWHLKSIAGRKRVALELGGNGAAIVCDDADLPWAAKRCAVGAFSQAGQVCIKVQRMYVMEGVYARFRELLLQEIAALRSGDPADPGVMVGPVIDARSADRICAWVDEAVRAGARVLCGNTREGNIIEPTLLEGTDPAMRIEYEEVFGPVATIAPAVSIGDAIERVNAGRFGLQAGIFTHDVRIIARAFDDLDVGGVIANDYPTLRVDNMPYGGIKDSGFGREGVRYAMEEMSERKVLVIKYA